MAVINFSPVVCTYPPDVRIVISRATQDVKIIGTQSSLDVERGVEMTTITGHWSNINKYFSIVRSSNMIQIIHS